MKSTRLKTAVVTGASTGIGHAISKVLSLHGWRVFGGVRKEEDGGRLATELGAGFVPLLFDVTDAEAVAAAAARVTAALDGETLDGLVNNAGIAVPGPLLYLTPQEVRHQFEVNVVGTLMVTQAFAPLLGCDRSRRGGPGRIVMMSSVGGTSATPFVGAYNASKFALEGLSEALRRELMLFRIDVIVVAPGAVATPIWDKGAALTEKFSDTPFGPAIARMHDFMKKAGKTGLPPDRIAKTVYAALTAAHPGTRLVITPDPLQHFVMNRFPKRMVDRFVAKMLELKP